MPTCIKWAIAWWSFWKGEVDRRLDKELLKAADLISLNAEQFRKAAHLPSSQFNEIARKFENGQPWVDLDEATFLRETREAIAQEDDEVNPKLRDAQVMGRVEVRAGQLN